MSFGTFLRAFKKEIGSWYLIKKRAAYSMVPETDPQFCRFWDVYPRRASKKDARKAWAKLNPSPALVEQIISALAWQVPAYHWDAESADYAPYPASWLNAERWTDERRQAPRAALSAAVGDPMQQWLQRKAGS